MVTNYRHPVFSSAHLDRIEQVMPDVCADSGREPAGFNGESQHVHLLVNLPPTAAISGPVNSPKGVPSRRPRQQSLDLRHHYWRVWRRRSGPYFAGSAARPSPPLRHYIERQQRPARPS